MNKRNQYAVACMAIIIGIMILAVATQQPQQQIEEPDWNARICLQDYQDCHSVNFYSQDAFIAYCEAKNGWYQISSTTTCVEGKEANT